MLLPVKEREEEDASAQQVEISVDVSQKGHGAARARKKENVYGSNSARNACDESVEYTLENKTLRTLDVSDIRMEVSGVAEKEAIQAEILVEIDDSQDSLGPSVSCKINTEASSTTADAMEMTPDERRFFTSPALYVRRKSKQSTVSAISQASSSSSAYNFTEAVVRDRLSAGLNIAMNCVRGLPMLWRHEMLRVCIKFGPHELKAYGIPDAHGNVPFCTLRTWPYAEESSMELHAVIVSELHPSVRLRDVGSALLDVVILADGFNGVLSLVSEDGLLAGPVLDITVWPVKMPRPVRSDEMVLTFHEYLPTLVRTQSRSNSNLVQAVNTSLLVMPETTPYCGGNDGLLPGADHTAPTGTAWLHPPSQALSPMDICVEISTGSGFQAMVATLGQLMEIIITVERRRRRRYCRRTGVS
eukprot:GEMP01025012.1.p1 GENE.GEMP01025012.1~~GEMP01025012.1.p1  ORF type:complete len:416 (+),score=86.56 GEMP01025012.1:157-1404(+)